MVTSRSRTREMVLRIAWRATAAKVSKGRPQSPLVVSAETKPLCIIMHITRKCYKNITILLRNEHFVDLNKMSATILQWYRTTKTGGRTHGNDGND